MKQLKSPRRFFLFVLIIGLFFSCGVEEYAYLKPVQSGNIRITLNNVGTITSLPNQDSSSNFTHYTLYYRIYISDIQETGEIQKSSAAMQRINPVLSADYFYLEPYTNSNNSVNTSTATLLLNRSYQVLAYEQGNDVVKNGPGSLELYFPVLTGSTPYLVYGGNSYSLYRSNGGGAFNPQPDRYFQNSSELNSSDNVSSTINADVVNKSGISVGPRYTYVSLYIAATGLNVPSYTPFYSIPTFIGVFRLPDRS
jgi:hypothetical protein